MLCTQWSLPLKVGRGTLGSRAQGAGRSTSPRESCCIVPSGEVFPAVPFVILLPAEKVSSTHTEDLCFTTWVIYSM